MTVFRISVIKNTSLAPDSPGFPYLAALGAMGGRWLFSQCLERVCRSELIPRLSFQGSSSLVTILGSHLKE